MTEYKLRSIEKQIFPTIRREYLKFFVVYFLIVDFYYSTIVPEYIKSCSLLILKKNEIKNHTAIAGYTLNAYFCTTLKSDGGLAQLASAFDWQSKGHGFESRILHRINLYFVFSIDKIKKSFQIAEMTFFMMTKHGTNYARRQFQNPETE